MIENKKGAEILVCEKLPDKTVAMRWETRSGEVGRHFEAQCEQTRRRIAYQVSASQVLRRERKKLRVEWQRRDASARKEKAAGRPRSGAWANCRFPIARTMLGGWKLEVNGEAHGDPSAIRDLAGGVQANVIHLGAQGQSWSESNVHAAAEAVGKLVVGKTADGEARTPY